MRRYGTKNSRSLDKKLAKREQQLKSRDVKVFLGQFVLTTFRDLGNCVMIIIGKNFLSSSQGMQSPQSASILLRR